MTTTGAPSGVSQLSVLLESSVCTCRRPTCPRTVLGYTDDGTLFAAFLVGKGMPPRAASRVYAE